MLTIPPYRSLIDGIVIKVHPWHTNLGVKGQGDHYLEDWFWEIDVENIASPFCSVKGAWAVYVTRSKSPVPLQFNTSCNATVFQLKPGEVPTEILVRDETIEGVTAIWLMIDYNRPDGESMIHCAGLYQYDAA